MVKSRSTVRDVRYAVLPTWYAPLLLTLQPTLSSNAPLPICVLVVYCSKVHTGSWVQAATALDSVPELRLLPLLLFA